MIKVTLRTTRSQQLTKSEVPKKLVRIWPAAPPAHECPEGCSGWEGVLSTGSQVSGPIVALHHRHAYLQSDELCDGLRMHVTTAAACTSMRLFRAGRAVAVHPSRRWPTNRLA